MNDTPIAVLQKAVDLGLKLSLKSPDTVTVKAAKPWPREFAQILRDYRRRMLALLRLPFCMVFSQILGETIFFCEDEHTKAAVVEAGADEWRIYTRDELRMLVAQNRAKPFLPEELCKLHEIKRTFNRRIST
jgi:hypothetical protein